MGRGPAVDVTMLVPGLLGPGGGSSNPGSSNPGSSDRDAAYALVDGLDLGALDRLLTRAECAVETVVDGSFEALAFRSFGYAARPADADCPVAAVTALIDCGAGGWASGLRADPVHLHADAADLVLFDTADTDLSGAESRALAARVNDALQPGGPSIDAAHPHRWYVALNAPARMSTTPLSLAAGVKISSQMPRGPDAPRWHRWMNEAQMALHECPVNIERERRGAAPINSIWPWGGGSLPPPAVAPFVQAWSDDAAVRGLARHAGIECGALPHGAGEWLGRAPPPGAHLIAFDALHRAAHRCDIDAWRAGIARFSVSWAKPLLGALAQGVVARVSIRDERGHRFVATRRGRLRWWRRGGLAAKIAGAVTARSGSALE